MKLPHLARQFDLMVKGARRMGLSCEDDFEELRVAAVDGSITAEQIAKLIDYDYRTGQDPLVGATTLIAALLKDATRENAHDSILAALKVARDCVVESFEYVESTDDQYLADARLLDIDRAIAIAKAEGRT